MEEKTGRARVRKFMGQNKGREITWQVLP